MAKNTRPALKPKLSKTKLRKRKRNKARNGRDRLSCLPDDILLSILSLLTTKEAAKTSLVSHKFKRLWHQVPVLHLEDSDEKLRTALTDRAASDAARSRFVCQVNNVVDQHLGPVVDDFRVGSFLGVEYQADIDKWVAFAFAMQVKSLVLDLCYSWPSNYLHGTVCKLETQSVIQLLPKNVATINRVLTSLSLNFVDVTAGVVECFLTSFPLLKHFRIWFAPSLTCIRASSSVSLEHLDVGYCDSLNAIDLSAPKLLSFMYHGDLIKLDLRNASALVSVSVCSFKPVIPQALVFVALSWYLPQLTYLKLCLEIPDEGVSHLDIDFRPKLTNLKHLFLHVYVKKGLSVLGLTPLIEASPVLQKLTLRFWYLPFRVDREVAPALETRPLEYLETLEIVGSVGHATDVELTSYVLKNANVLKEVVFDDWSHFRINNPRRVARSLRFAEKLKQMLPQSVRLMFTAPDKSVMQL